MFGQKDADPKAIAQEVGFDDHREMAQYMESKGLMWAPEKKNYVEGSIQDVEAASEEEDVLECNIVSLSEKRHSKGGQSAEVVLWVTSQRLSSNIHIPAYP